MTRLIFAFMQAYGGDERESLMLARSLRMFGGELAKKFRAILPEAGACFLL